MNSLILPTPENSYKPPVKSFVLRKKGARTGIRLISWNSLMDFIRAHEDGCTVETAGRNKNPNTQ